MADTYPLWGENPSHIRHLDKIAALAGSSATARVPAAWCYAGVPSQVMSYANANVPIWITDIRISANGAWLANSSYSVVKVTYVCQSHFIQAQDEYVMTTNYGNVTVNGADMVKNAAPSTATTSSTYAIYDNLDPYSLSLITMNTRFGKMKNVGLTQVQGWWQIVVWCGNEYFVIRAFERGK